jgi:KUP system potassium uptake protein
VYKKNCLLILVLIGTCTAIGDGILTPAISVLSASGGIRVQNQKMSTGNSALCIFILVLSNLVNYLFF